MPPVATRIFPSAENPLGLVLELSEKLRFSEPCPLSPSDGFRAANSLAAIIEFSLHVRVLFWTRVILMTLPAGLFRAGFPRRTARKG